MSDADDKQQLVISYLTLRRAIGLLGILFPVLLAGLCWGFGDCNGLEPAISDYYHTDVRDLFVGILFTIGWFLFSYKGYEKADDIAGDLACAFALGVALFPTNSEVALVRTLHFVCALGLFLVLAYFSLFLFRKSCKTPTPQKLMRNKVYLVCGILMLLCIALIGAYFAWGEGSSLDEIQPVFWLESLALWAFGFSWITKGEMLWPDRKP